MAALLTRPSTLPNSATARSNRAVTSSAWPVWQATARARPPAALMAAATSCNGSTLRAASTTAAPAWAAASVMAWPMPRLAPVMTTTRFCRWMAALMLPRVPGEAGGLRPGLQSAAGPANLWASTSDQGPMGSLIKKRRKKMSKHKYRKRLRADRHKRK